MNTITIEIPGDWRDVRGTSIHGMLAIVHWAYISRYDYTHPGDIRQTLDLMEQMGDTETPRTLRGKIANMN